jgi:hypothetical protein
MKDNNNYKSIQVITLDEGIRIIMVNIYLTQGRGHDTDVRINDISVSRTHAIICLINNKIIIKDLKSKFGTLALLRESYEVTDKTLCLQIGRSYTECNVITHKDFQKLKSEVATTVHDKSKNKQLFRK